MRLEILDAKQVGEKTWALCKGNLLQYLRGLKTDFFEFSVQRKIVNNVYLDNIYYSVEQGEPFPPVTLTYEGTISLDPECNTVELDENKIEILDGLQRTYRLWVIIFFDELIKKSGATDLKTLADAAMKTTEGEVVLQNKFVTPKFIKSLFDVKEGKRYVDRIIESYSNLK